MTATDYFEGRLGYHDQACSIFLSQLTDHHIESIPIGLEFNKFGASKILKFYDTDISRHLRHSPDICILISKDLNILVDIKSEAGNYSNYSIEADSLYTSLELTQINKPVFFACVTLQDGDIKLIRASDIIPPVVFVPRPERYEDMKKKFTQSRVEFKQTRSGSGTPYILVPKTHPRFINLSDFLISPEGKTMQYVWKIDSTTLQQQLIQGVTA